MIRQRVHVFLCGRYSIQGELPTTKTILDQKKAKQARSRRDIERSEPVVSEGVDYPLKVFPLLDVAGRPVIAHFIAINIVLFQRSELKKASVSLFLSRFNHSSRRHGRSLGDVAKFHRKSFERAREKIDAGRDNKKHEESPRC